jgi:hypothetical protein
MSFQFVSFAVAVFVAAVVLMVVGGFGEIEALLYWQCGASGYLCDPPTGGGGHSTR